MTSPRISSALTVALCWGGVIVGAAGGISAQTVPFVPVGSIAGPADLVRVQGRYAYVSAGKTLTVVDISNPSAPTRTGAYTFPEKIWGFRVVGNVVYVAADFFGLGILDIAVSDFILQEAVTSGTALAIPDFFSNSMRW